MSLKTGTVGSLCDRVDPTFKVSKMCLVAPMILNCLFALMSSISMRTSGKILHFELIFGAVCVWNPEGADQVLNRKQ